MTIIPRLRQFLLAVCLAPALLTGQVNLDPSTSPAAAAPGSGVTVRGTGFPTGTIAASAVTVTITPPPGNGSPVSTQAGAIVTSGGSRIVNFTVPAALTTAAPMVCTVALSGATTTNTSFTTATTSRITVNPPAVVSNVAPGAGQSGTTVDVLISGKYTNFQGASSITAAPAGVTATLLSVSNTGQLRARFVIQPNATPGPRSVSVRTGTETATLANAFVVTATPALSFSSLSPNQGSPGQTLNVDVTGINTKFLQGTTFANFGEGIRVNSLTVLSLTTARANVTVDPISVPGWRQVTFVTGGEFAVTGDQGFQVTITPATLSAITPVTGAQGTNLSVTLTGVNTHFAKDATTLDLGSGINVGNVRVDSATSLTASISIAQNATPGVRTATVRTGGEVVSLASAFTVVLGSPYLSGVTPTSGQQGQTLTLTITGVLTAFTQGDVTLTLGDNVTVSGVTVGSPTSATANVAIGVLAATGVRTAVLRSAGRDYPFQFTVNPSGAALSVAPNPSSGQQGTAVAIALAGSNTTWVQGTTTVELYIPSVFSLTTNRVTVSSATSAVADITIPANAVVGTYTLRITTGGEVLLSTFRVLSATPTVTMTPSGTKVGTSVSVTFLGSFTHFRKGITTANIDGSGVAIQNFQVTGDTTATATMVVAADAPPGGRTVTLTTGTEVVNTGSEITRTSFGAYTQPAAISVSPDYAVRGNTLTLNITGYNTNFTSGTPTVSMGPDVTINSVSVVNATRLTASVTIASSAALGWRTLFVNTGGDQLMAGFRVDAIQTLSTISAVAPSSGAQGQSLTLTITGQNTSFEAGKSQLIVGAGVTVNQLNILNATTATAVVAVSTTAPVGPNAIIMITGNETASGTGFNVTPGASQITSVTPTDATQNQTLRLALTGQGTNWLQGASALDFGGGVVVNSLTIQSPTQATAVITILSNASLGFRTARMITDGQISSMANALNIQQGTPALLSSTPNSGNQGETLNIQVQGRFTNWVTDVTTASFGTGITVNKFTAGDSISGVINITIGQNATVDSFPCRTLTITTGTQQVSLPNQFCVRNGAAVLTSLSPTSGAQGQTMKLQVKGQNTNFVNGVTTASIGAGINVSAVTVTSTTDATLDIAITAGAATGLRTLTLTTLGESASITNAFTVTAGGTPTLNGATPATGQQGVTISQVNLIGQFTHFAAGTTTATFGPGITVNSLTVVDATTARANITIDPLAYPGGRTVTVTTGAEVVSANIFTVLAGPAILQSIDPQRGNQGQENVTVQFTGENTHWAPGLTQFYIGGQGYDLTVNSFIVNSATSATANLSIGATAALGSRYIGLTTAGESVANGAGFVVTGGIPSLLSLNSASAYGGYAARPGDTNVNVQIRGAFTQWQTGVTTVDFGPGITVTSVVIGNATNLTAVVNVDANATLGPRTVTIRTGTQALTTTFSVVNPAPPTPYIQYFTPSAGLPGQTFTVNITGLYTAFDPATTQVTFGAGVQVNTFQVTSATTARANITVLNSATAGTRTVQVTTGASVQTAAFSVVIATPSIRLVDPSSGMQGETKDVNVLGEYTDFGAGTAFSFGSGITVNSVNILASNVARLNISVGQLATLGGRSVSATTGGTTVTGGSFSVTPSLALVSMVSPNTALQNDTVQVTVTGKNTHWDSSTTFAFGSGISVVSKNVTSATSASVTLTIAALATVGSSGVTATTQGEVASMANAFVVQPGTSILLSSGPSSAQQQTGVTLTILGQFTQFVQGQTSVNLGSGVTVGTVTVTSPTALTAQITVQPTAFPGSRTLTVVTGAQTLTLPSAFSVTAGPAAISLLNPAAGNQGETLNVVVTGVNTSFVQGVTTASFGAGITANSVTVASPTSATVNITIAANATPALNTVTLTTAGESARILSGFTIRAATPVVSLVTPSSAAQGETRSVTVTGQFTSFGPTTTADFGPGITVNSVSASTATSASVGLTVSPTATPGTRNVTLTTGTQVAVKSAAFTVNPGSAVLSSVAPNTGRQNQTGLAVVITGSGTNFTAATPTVSFGNNVTVTQVQVASNTSLAATINIDPNAAQGARPVTVTTGGQVATLANGFTVQPGNGVLTSASPVTARQNDTLDVTVTGNFIDFTQGALSSSFGAGITVNSITAINASQARVNITISPSAALGSRTVTATSAGNTATGVGIFTVLAGLPQISSVTPNTGAQSSTQSVTINGLFTSFQAGVTTVSIGGSGVSTGTVVVNGPTQLQVPVTVTGGAPAGARTVTVTTGAESASLAGAFTVQPGLPAITVLSPNQGVPNSTVSVTITGQFTNFVGGTTRAKFGAGIAVNGGTAGDFGVVTVQNAFSATASLVIDAAATVGPRDVTVQTSAEVLNVTAGFTVQTASPTPAVISASAPANGVGGVPTNTKVVLQFDKPLDRTTLSTSNVSLMDQTLAGYCGNPANALPASVSVDASGRQVTLSPSSVLAVGRQFYVCVNYGVSTLKDASGNTVSGAVRYFTTGFAPDNSGPAFQSASIAASDTGVPTNARIIARFDKQISPLTQAGNLTLTTGGNTVAGTWGYNSAYTEATFTPSTALSASTVYALNYSAGLQDTVGNALTNPGSLSFTTGTGTESSAPVVTSYTPTNNSTTGVNPTFAVVLDKPIDPGTVTYNLTNQQIYATVPGTSWTVSPDRRTVRMTLAAPLDPSTRYRFDFYSYSRAGNYSGTGAYFTTSAAADTAAPTVSLVSPPASATGVPVNAKIQARFSEALDPTTIQGTFTITPNVAGTLTVASDGVTLQFVPTANLSPSQVYTVQLAGLKDLSGNALASPYSWSFTTAASSASDTSAGTVSMLPASSATNVARNTTIVFSLSKPVNPASVNKSSLRVYLNTNSQDVAGTYTTSADYRTVTFTPTGNLPASTQICTYVGYYGYLTDWAGNNFNPIYNQCFTTAAGVDTTAPTVISVTPLPSATGIGPSNPVTITFSKPMNPSLLNSSVNVAIYRGSTLHYSGGSLSSDGTSVTMTPTLPYDATLTVVVTPSVADLAGNQLAAEYRSTFTTIPQPSTSRPSVSAFRPGAGANVAPGTLLTFFLSQAIAPSTVPAAMKVSQNGVLITGTTQVTSGNRVVTFTPSAPFQAGALIQVWFTSAAADSVGNALIDYQTSFTIAPDLTSTALQLSSYWPGYYNTVPRNAIIEARFNKPVNPATVTAASFYLSNSIAGTISFRNNNTVIRFTPSAVLPASSQITFTLTSAIRDTNGQAFGGQSVYFYTNAITDTAPLTVSAVAPTNASTSIGVNALIRVTFSKQVDTNTIDASTLTLSAGGNAIPYTFSYDGTNTITLTPQAPLPPSSAVTVAVTSGVTDYYGLTCTPSSTTFNTAAGPDFTNASVISSTVNSSSTDVPVTSVFTITWDRPMDGRMFSFSLRDNLFYTYPTATITTSPDGRSVTIAPTALLAVNRQYYLSVSGNDLTGNYGNGFSASFTTALTAPAGGPQVISAMPLNSMTGIPANFKPIVQFDRSISPASLAGITLTAGGTPVLWTPSFSAGNTVLTLVPSSILQPNTSYTLTIAGVTDSAGTAMSGSVTRAFQTGASIDLVAPTVTSTTPISGSTTGTNPVIRFTFSERINPLLMGAPSLYNTRLSYYLTGIQTVYAADLLSATITYPGSLDPSTSSYSANLGAFYDLAGNYNYASVNFTTGSGADTTPPVVSSSNPPNGATGVPVNAKLTFLMSQQLDPTAPGSVTLTPTVAGATTVSSDGLTITFTPAANLTASQTFAVSVSGYRDLSGNVMTPFSSSFTSGSGVDNSAGTISMTSPAPSAVGVAVNSAITFTLSKAVNPVTVVPDVCAVSARISGSDVRVAGSITIGANGTTLVFTPTSALPPSTLIVIYAGYYATLRDLAGNAFGPLYNAQFTTAATPDATAPQVISVSPTNNSTSAGPNAAVTLTFSKSIDPTTITAQNFTLYNGFTNLNAGVTRASDNRSVTLSTTLPYGSTITVNVGTGVRDVAGNALAAPFRSTFSTINQPITSTGNITLMRPGSSGVPLNSVITLFTSTPIMASTAATAVNVAQNGALVTGTVTVSADNRSIVWTPSVPFASNAYVQVFVTTNLSDASGRPFSAYSGSFTTVQDLTAVTPSLVSYYPSYYQTVATNTMLQFQFNKPINPTSVTGANFQLVGNNNVAIPVTLSQPWPNVIRMVPVSYIPPGSNPTMRVISATDTNGLTYGGQTSYFYTGSGPDTVTPQLAAVAPTNGSTGIGNNATIRFVFNKLMDTVSINSSTVTLKNGATSLPFSLSFSTTSSGATTVTLTPQAPLPLNATITLQLLAGINDLQARNLTAQTVTFQTGSGPDFTAPTVVYSSPDGNTTQNVPVNAVVTLVTSKPIDPGSLTGGSTYMYRTNNCCTAIPATVSQSADGQTITLAPSANMTPSTQHYATSNFVDLNGNSGGWGQYFTTASGTDTVAPQVLTTNPINGASNAPTNAQIDVLFNEPVRATSLTGITLKAGATTIPVTATLNTGNTVVRIVPSALLLTNTAYTLTITGVQDIAGNTMSGTVTSTFTTGLNTVLAGPAVTAVRAQVGGTPTPIAPNTTLANVQTSSTLQVTFSAPVSPVSLINTQALYLINTNTSAAIPVTASLSADGLTATVTPNSPLAAGTSYTLFVSYYASVRDQAGNAVGYPGYYRFTTQ